MATPETLRALLVANASVASQQQQSQQQRADLPVRTKHLCGAVNEFLYKCANEPSVAGHRIQEHVYKTVPSLAREWQNITTTTNHINGVLFDLDYTTNFFDKLDDSIQNSTQTRETISDLASKVSAATSRVARQPSVPFSPSI